MPSSLQDIVKIIEDDAEKRKIKRQIDEGIIKPLDELIVSGIFTVDEIISQAAMTSVVDGEVVIGGRNSSRETGQNYFSTLKVTPRMNTDPDNESPVNKLNFYGMTPVRSGENIMAQIPRYSTIKVRCKMTSCYDDGIEELYTVRKFRTEETAVEISILNDHGSIIRIDRSSDYKRFFPVKSSSELENCVTM